MGVQHQTGARSGMASANNIERFRNERGWSRPELGRRMGTSGQQVERLEKGQRKLSHEWIERAAAALEVGAGEIIAGEPMALPPASSDHAPTRSADAGETAPVLRLDLSYSMGPGRDLDDSYVEGEPFEIDLGLLRSMTITPPDRIRLVDGIGDSMQPTIHDRDLLFVDVNQATLNAQDRIWAIWLFGLGAVKRLRAIDADRVEVISDNPEVANQIVNRADILIHGRVVGSIKRH